MKVTFDTSSFKNSTLSDSDLYVTFAAASASMTYNTGKSAQSITFASNNITIDGESYGTSNAYSLKDINNRGLVLHSAVSLVGFVSYGSTAGIEKLAAGSQPSPFDTKTARYSVFEISYNGSTGGADVTNISQFGGSIKLSFLANSTVQSYVGNTLDTTKTFRKLAAASGFSGTKSTAALLLDSNGKFLRVIGANMFPSGTTKNPYPTFNAYLKALNGTSHLSIKLTNLAPGQSPGGTGSAGFKSTANATKVSPNTVYNLDYHFSAAISQVTAPSTAIPHGTYSVKLTGHVNATLAAADSSKTQSFKYKNLSIDIAADDLPSGDLYMTNFIYQSATTGTGIDVTDSGWSNVNNDFGKANADAALLLKAAGDFAEGMISGFPGSTVTSDSTPSKKLGDLTSYEWWKNPLLAYDKAQPANAYYSQYGNVINGHSSALNGGVTYDRGGVYAAPYDDRFDINLIGPDSSTDEMKITLLKDGDLTPS